MPAFARPRSVVLFLVLASALLAPAHPAAAATFTVTVTTDSADGACDAHCSFREAISAANSSGGPTSWSSRRAPTP